MLLKYRTDDDLESSKSDSEGIKDNADIIKTEFKENGMGAPSSDDITLVSE